MGQDDGMQPEGEIQQREKGQKRDRQHDVGNDHRREQQGIETAGGPGSPFDPERQQRAQRRGDGGRFGILSLKELVRKCRNEKWLLPWHDGCKGYADRSLVWELRPLEEGSASLGK